MKLAKNDNNIVGFLVKVIKPEFSEFKSWSELKNLFIRYSQINFCLDTKIYFASSALASTIIRLFGRGTSFQFRAFSALVVLNYSYCCPDCGVRIELACLF